MSQPIGFVGVGEIATAIVDGLGRGRDPAAPEIYLSPRSERMSAALARRHPNAHVCPDNQSVANQAQLLILAVRPESIDHALSDLRMPRGSILVSAVAGVSHRVLRHHVGPHVTVVRTIPLPAVRHGNGITAVYPAHPLVTALFEPLGGTLEIADADAFAALSTSTATISAHLGYLGYLASIVGWVTRHGIDPAAAVDTSEAFSSGSSANCQTTRGQSTGL